ncbi:hypothetical protein [Burkholderia contaminans]|uniref:hypothetical protein n=1 Tax=Burkholderia contaminans TaxID=488447 RepID=UPI00158357CD|nr:hypothetical protein [Burkholderia contaminans]
MLRALKNRDAARAAYRAGRVEGDARIAQAEDDYATALKQYREMQREKVSAGIVFAVSCGAVVLHSDYPRGPSWHCFSAELSL